MREIKFRGFTTDCIDNEWVYGDLIHYDTDETYIIPQNDRYWDISDYENRVDETTVGQFTGLKDKNGKEIYEGDILKYKRNDISEENFKLYWNEKMSAFYLQNILWPDDDIAVKYYRIENIEIIGNIFENKELLKTRG